MPRFSPQGERRIGISPARTFGAGLLRGHPPCSSRMTSGWEATPEGDQQTGRPLQADLPADQGPDEVPLLRQETEPGPAVGDDAEVGGADMPRLDPDQLSSDDDRRLSGLLPGEFEVIR